MLKETEREIRGEHRLSITATTTVAIDSLPRTCHLQVRHTYHLLLTTRMKNSLKTFCIKNTTYQNTVPVWELEYVHTSYWNILLIFIRNLFLSVVYIALSSEIVFVFAAL